MLLVSVYRTLYHHTILVVIVILIVIIIIIPYDMASMIAKLWTRLCAKRVPLSIMIVGLDNSGKTSILNYLASQNHEAHSRNQSPKSNAHSSSSSSSAGTATNAITNTNTTITRSDKGGGSDGCQLSSSGCGGGGNIMPTFGYNYERIQYKNVSITVLDFSGQNRYRNLWQEFYNSVDGLVFVIDSSDLIRLVVVRDELETMLSHPYFHSLTQHGQLQLPYPVASEAVQKQITISQGKLIQSPLDGALSASSSSMFSMTNDKARGGTNDNNLTLASTARNKLSTQNTNSGCGGGRLRTRVPILFLANKTDLASSVDTEVIAKALNLSQLPLERHPWYIQATSVKLSQGIGEGFDWLVNQLSVN